MKLKKLAPKKNAAQAIVEFAIVLPLLLLLLYGLLEAGRLLFVYSSIVTASRQAARYGSATGQGSDFSADGGPSNTGFSRYQDCAGIRWSAQRADFLDAFDDGDIDIEYDGGRGVALDPAKSDDVCTGGTNVNVHPYNDNTTRITVTVTGHFSSIVPKIVPFFNRTIEATSSRTILMSISIPAAGAGGGGTTPGILVASSPNPSQVNEPVTFTATVTDPAGGTPTGTVTFTVGSTTCTATLASGVASCPNMTFSAIGSYTINATYNPATSAYVTATGSAPHVVGPSVTITKITQDTPDPSLPGTSIPIYVTVENQYPGGNTPTGTVAITTSPNAGGCNFTLNSGGGYCSITFNSTSTITATYTPADTTKHYASSGSDTHTVQTTLPTAVPTSIPTAIPTAVPTTIVTPVPTDVLGCESIRNSVGSIVFPQDDTMYLSIPNTNKYPVTIESVFVAWNYSAGHSPGNSSVNLTKAQLNSTQIWSGSLNQQSAKLPLSTTAVLAGESTTRLTFTFNKAYNRTTSGVEQVHIYFSTPGCKSFPVIVPVGAPTITPVPTTVPTTAVPSASAKLQYKAANVTASSQWIKPHFNIVNTGGTALPLSGFKTRYWFTREGTANQSFSCDYAVVNCSYVTGTFVAVSPARTGADYYLEVGFTAAAGSIAGGGQSGEIQTGINMANWGNYTQTNDYSYDSTKSSFADWTRVTLYYNGVLVWGTEP